MQYQIVAANETREGWLEFAFSTDGKVLVFIPASWGDKRAALQVMQAGLAGVILPEGQYRIIKGRQAEISAEISRIKCMLLGPPIVAHGNFAYQAVIEGVADVSQARETWGELIASRMRAHVAQPG